MAGPLIHSVTLKLVSFPFKTAFVTAAGHKQRTDNVQITLQLSDGTLGKAEASSSIALASESRTFHSVRCEYSADGVSFS